MELYATESTFVIKKNELRTIFDLLTQTNIKSDMIEFFSWCKEVYEDQKPKNPILDLDEVGNFFVELMDQKVIDLKTLPLVGFDFLA